MKGQRMKRALLTLTMASATMTAAIMAFAVVLPAAAAPKPAGSAAAAPAKYDAAKLSALEAKLKKSPNDQKLKLETAQANYEVGHTIEYNPDLPPRTKYRDALAKYNRALALNPKLAAAAKEKKQIEDIYRQMGRPIPQ
jgi:hypothetical protein